MTRRRSVRLAIVSVVLAITMLLVIGRSLLSHQPLISAPPSPPLPREGSEPLSLPPPDIPSPSPWMQHVTRAATPPLTDTDNILLAGLDTRPSWQSSRTDALIVVVLDRRHGHAGLVSVPRDLLVSVDAIQGLAVDAGPGSGAGVRINTVYQRAGGGERGVAALSGAVKRVLGLPIAHVVMVDHAGFESLIDALGGLSVVVRCPIVERFIDPREPTGHRLLSLAPGLQRMDGATALMFARARHGRGIYDRARRQQALLDGLRLRLLGLGLDRARRLLPLLRQTVFTDLTTLDLLRLARQLARVDRRAIHGLVLDSRHAHPAMLGGKRWVLIPDPPKVHAALTELFASAAPGERRWRRCPPADAGFRHRSRRAR